MKIKITYLGILLTILSFCNRAWGQSYDEWSGNIAGGIYEGYKKLTGDVTLTGSGAITISQNTQLTIDLNGYTITGRNVTYGHVFYDDGTLTIEDKSASKSGVITGGTGDRGGCMKVGPGAKFYFKGGTIKDCHPRFNDSDKTSNQGNAVNALSIGAGGAIYINTGGYVEMDGGNIVECSTHTTATNINGGGTYYNNVGFGGAVFVHGCENSSTYTETTFVLKSGTIEGCYAGSGGAVYLYTLEDDNLGRKAIFNMTGGTIRNCSALYQSNAYGGYGGGAVMVNEFGEFNMTGGTIDGCETKGHGCGVHVLGRMNMSGTSKITNCKPVGWIEVEWDDTNKKWTGTGSSDGDLIDDYLYVGGTLGGGIHIYGEKSYVNMTGGEISNNRAGSGGGVLMYYADGDYTKGGVFVMDGPDAVIMGNKVYGKGIGNGAGLYAAGSTFEFINGTIKDNVARRYGGGINIHHDAKIIMEGNKDCIIYNNSAMHGGGISQEIGKCNITLNNENIIIERNYAHGIGYSKGSTTGAGPAEEEGMGNGGGIFAEQGTLTIKKGTIRSNTATGHGGGVVLRTREPGVTINAFIEGGIISGNTAIEGGGVYINVNDDNSIAQMTVGTSTSIPEIVSNTAIKNGGGLGLNNGDITINQGKIEYNKAINGAGISIENGKVIIDKGEISNNISTENGGGLYVYNSGTTQRSISFAGGTFSDNTARNGGGAYVEGYLNIDLQATIQNNSAINGGAIYLKGQGASNKAVMTFGNGLIRANKALADEDKDPFTTAYRSGKETLHGVGGGIFMDSFTELSFNVTDGFGFGLYNNGAENAADDVFANGNSTRVTLPEVKSMELRGFDVPTTELYWIEDYVAGDINYADGTNIIATDPDAEDKGIYRYRYAVEHFKHLWHLPEQNLSSYRDKYLCLTLGYEQTYFHLTKKGLEEGDNIAFILSYLDPDYPDDGTDPDKYIEYRKVYMYGIENDADVSVTVVIPVGKWKVRETTWSSKYNEPKYQYEGDIIAPEDNDGDNIITDEYIIIDVKNNITNTLTVINEVLESFNRVDIRDFEFHKVNFMKP